MKKILLYLFILLFLSFSKARITSCNNTAYDFILESCDNLTLCSYSTCDSCYMIDPTLCFKCVENYFLDVISRNCTQCNLDNQTTFGKFCLEATNLTINASLDEIIGKFEINGTCLNASKIFVAVGPSELVFNQTPLSVSQKLANKTFYFDYDSWLYLATNNQTTANSTNLTKDSFEFLVDSQFIRKSNESNYTALAFCTDKFVFNNKSVILNISDNGGKKTKILVKYKAKLNITQRYKQAKHFKDLLNLSRSHVVWDDNGDLINDTEDLFGELGSSAQGRILLNLANQKTYDHETPRFLEEIFSNDSNITNTTDYGYVTYFNRLYNNKVDNLYQKVFDLFLPKDSVNSRGFDLYFNTILSGNDTFPPITNISVSEIDNILPILSHTSLPDLYAKTTNHSISLTFEINNTNGFIMIGLTPAISNKKVTIESLVIGKDDEGNDLNFFEQVYLEKGKPKEILMDNLEQNVYSVFVAAGSDTFRYEQKFTEYYKYYIATASGVRIVKWFIMMILLMLGIAV